MVASDSSQCLFHQCGSKLRAIFQGRGTFGALMWRRCRPSLDAEPFAPIYRLLCSSISARSHSPQILCFFGRNGRKITEFTQSTATILSSPALVRGKGCSSQCTLRMRSTTQNRSRTDSLQSSYFLRPCKETEMLESEAGKYAFTASQTSCFSSQPWISRVVCVMRPNFRCSFAHMKSQRYGTQRARSHISL